MFFLKLLPPLLLCLLSFKAFSQYNLDVLSPANGLVDAKVQRIYQDSLGRLFFLTRDGFSMYDGKRMLNYVEADGKKVHVSTALMEMEKDEVWILHLGYTAFKLKGLTIHADTSTFYPCTELREAWRLGNKEWMIESFAGLFLFNKNGLQPFCPFDIENQSLMEGLGSMGNYFVLQDRNLGTESLQFINLKDKKVKHRFSLPSNCRTFRIEEGSLWFIHNDRLSRIRLNNDQAPFIDLTIDIPLSLKNQKNKQCLQFIQNECWWQTGPNTLASFSVQTKELKWYQINYPRALPVYNLYRDREENTWLLIRGMGAARLVPTNFKEWKPNSYIASLQKIPDGVLFLEGNDRITERNQNNIYNRKLPGSSVPFAFKNGNEIWTINNDHLVSLSGKSIPLDRNRPLEDQYLNSKNVTYDSKGNALLAGYYFTLFKEDGSHHTISLPYYCDNILQDSEGYYWALVRNNDVVKMQWKDNRLELVKKWNLAKLNPRYSILWKPNVLAVGTRHQGLVFLTEENGELKETGRIRQAEGLSNDFVTFLNLLDSNTLVVSTGAGLDKLTIQDQDTIIEKISAPDQYFSQMAETAFYNDTLWVRSIDGQLFYWQPSLPKENAYHPQLRLSGLFVNGDTVQEQSTVFGYRNNNFRFEFSAPSFINTRDIEYAFHLHSGDRNWKTRSAQSYFEINNLDPGDYHLEVTVSFPGRRYPDQTFNYAFTIQQPIWQTIWFRLLLAAALLLTIILIVRSIYRKKLIRQRILLEKKQAVEKERSRIATDMHDDLGAGLSRIKFLSERIQLQNSSQPLSSDLRKISAYSDEMAEKMGEIVWALNQRYDSAEDLVAFCRAYASEFLEENKIVLHFSEEIQQPQMLNGETRRNLFLVVKEALHNIVRHASATEVHISMKIRNDLRITITDNGKGFEKDHVRPFANGIENMKRRMHEIGGSLEIRNQQGTHITLSINSLP